MSLTWFAVAVFFFGLIFGSFFNALVWRWVRKDKMTERHSRCVHCRRHLAAIDLIPVASFVLLGGRCRYCHKPIPWHYPLVELATGLVLVPVALVFGISWTAGVVAVLTLFLEALFLLDLRYSILPDSMTLPGAVVAAIAGVVLGHAYESVLIGGILGAGFFLLQFLLSRGQWIGGGDIRLGALMGLALGWRDLLIALFLAYIAGSIVGLFLVASKRKRWKSHVPFGTFLAVATYCVLLFGEVIWQAYLRLLYQ